MWRKIWRQSKVSAARLMPATANKLHFHCSSQVQGKKKAGGTKERMATGERKRRMQPGGKEMRTERSKWEM